MKKFSYTVAKIKNQNGEFETIPALRGDSTYELAVENGYEGTKDEWLASMSDGWVEATENLRVNKADKSDVYTRTQLDTTFRSIRKDLEKASSVPNSYLALVGNVNADMVSAALGKNNEDVVTEVGKALAMYARFKDPTIILAESFPNLVTRGKLSDFTNETINELNVSPSLRTLFTGNEYAFDNGIVPSAGVITTKNNHPDIAFGSYTGVWTTYNSKTGLHFKYNYAQSFSTFDTVESTSSFDTNGSKYLIYHVLYNYPRSEGTRSFGVIGDDGETRSNDHPEIIGDNSKWSVIDVSDFTSVKLRVTTNRDDSGSGFVLDNIMFTDFLPDGCIAEA